MDFSSKDIKELERVKAMHGFENEIYNKGIKFIAGVDEAGRGPLAGPVYAAAVILPKNIIINGINDSKKISATKRAELYETIIKNAISYNIVSVSEGDVDEINIRNATFKGMVKAVDGLKTPPEHVLIDGDGILGLNLPYTTIVRGDSLSISIAAASILAKVSRDKYIISLDQLYPQYGFAKHKGYGTREHIAAIKKYGICPIHRKTFVSKIVNA